MGAIVASIVWLVVWLVGRVSWHNSSLVAAVSWPISVAWSVSVSGSVWVALVVCRTVVADGGASDGDSERGNDQEDGLIWVD